MNPTNAAVSLPVSLRSLGLPVGRLLSVLLAAGAVGIAGCASSDQTNTTIDDAAGTPVGQATPGTEIGSQTGLGTAEFDGFVVRYDDWAQLGYRLDWTGKAQFRERETPMEVTPYPDFVVVQGNRGTVSVLNASTGRRVWSEAYAYPLAGFYGVVRPELLPSNEPELLGVGLVALGALSPEEVGARQRADGSIEYATARLDRVDLAPFGEEDFRNRLRSLAFLNLYALDLENQQVRQAFADRDLEDALGLNRISADLRESGFEAVSNLYSGRQLAERIGANQGELKAFARRVLRQTRLDADTLDEIALGVRQLEFGFIPTTGGEPLGNTLLVPTTTELFQLELASGNIENRTGFSAAVSSGGVSVENLLVLGSATGELFAHVTTINPQSGDGVKAWGYRINGSIRQTPLLLDGGVVGAVSAGGEVLFVDVNTGDARGRFQMSGGVESPPVADASRMYVASLDRSIYAFDVDGAVEAWRFRTQRPIRATPTLYNRVLYITLEDQDFTAIDATNGRKLWSAAGVTGQVIAVRSGNLLVWNGTKMTVLDPRRGTVIDELTIRGVDSITTDELVEGGLIVTTSNGTLLRFAPRTLSLR